MINASLSISPLINVTASLAQLAAQAQSTQTLLVLGSSPVIDVLTRKQTFNSAIEVAELFGGDAPETAFAVEWFDQSPQPLTLDIGRWAQTATNGQLLGAPLLPATQIISVWQAITDGGFAIAIDGAAVEQISPLNFAGADNLNGVAAVIQAKLTGATIVFDSVNQRFVITSDTTGATSSVSFATAPTGVGITDISTMLGLTVASDGAFQANGIVAETALAAVTLFDENFGQEFYGLSVLGAADADHQAIAPFLKASSNKHFYFISTQETGVLVAATTTDIASVLSAAVTPKTAIQFNGGSAFSVASLAARILTVDYTGSATAITLMYKQEPGITPDRLNSTQLAAALAKNCNVFVSYNNGANIIQPGVCCDGNFIDTIIGADALTLAIQAAVFNLLFTTTTKIDQDDPGMHRIKVTIESILEQFRRNGYIAPGQWNGPLFGSLVNGSDGTPPTLTKGYYVFQPPIASQPQAQRSARVSVPFQIAVKLAGAVQTVDVAITLNN